MADPLVRLNRARQALASARWERTAGGTNDLRKLDLERLDVMLRHLQIRSAGTAVTMLTRSALQEIEAAADGN